MNLRWVAGAVAIPMLVAACGGGGESGADALGDAIGEEIWKASEEDIASGADVPFQFTESDANCLGHAFVDAFGYDELVEAGLSADAVRDDVTGVEEVFDLVGGDQAETAEKIFTGMDDCIDLTEAMAAAGAAEMGISEASATCLFGGLMDASAFRDAMVAGMFTDAEPDFESDPAIIGEMFSLMNECLSDDELSQIVGG